MSANNRKGLMIGMGITIYVIAKLILNMFITDVMDPITAAIGAVTAVMTIYGVKYTNYIIAGIFALVVLIHLPGNISNIGSNWVFLAEGVIDLGCAALLCLNKNVKEQFSGND